MGLAIREVQSLDERASKVVVEGQPLSSSDNMSISQVIEYYHREESKRSEPGSTAK